MKKSILATFVAAATLLVAGSASAANYSLWVQGRGGVEAVDTNFGYWGSAATAAGVNKKAVNWDGTQKIDTTNYRLRNALDTYCKGTNWCYLAAHSAGAAQVEYAISLYGLNAGWNIKWVDMTASAAGGSELSDSGSWLMGEPLASQLKTSTMRSLYNHNTTRGLTYYMFAGASGTFYAGVLPGQDDEAVSYHSSGGVSVTGSFCNPGDWFCDGTLYTGSSGTSNGKALFTGHTVQVRDDSESYNHYANSVWGGIIAPTRSDMVTYAL